MLFLTTTTTTIITSTATLVTDITKATPIACYLIPITVIQKRMEKAQGHVQLTAIVIITAVSIATMTCSMGMETDEDEGEGEGEVEDEGEGEEEDEVEEEEEGEGEEEEEEEEEGIDIAETIESIEIMVDIENVDMMNIVMEEGIRVPANTDLNPALMTTPATMKILITRIIGTNPTLVIEMYNLIIME